MAILVDGANWRWRGQRWAHLVSDESLAELHAFAGRIGLERRWFQGDHYDVPAHVRARALGMGARAVSSEELVRRLRAAGLRRRSRVVRLPGEGASPTSRSAGTPAERDAGEGPGAGEGQGVGESQHAGEGQGPAAGRG